MNSNSAIIKKKLGIIVCADDFGTTSEVNGAVIRLLGKKRISAVSCLVSGKAWEQGAVVLKNYRGLADIGLHLFYEDLPFKKILSLAYTNRLNKELILKKFRSQWERFVKDMGMLPDYIDGHQHIHQLPVFRSALMDLMGAAKLNKLYIRNSALGLNDILNRRVSILKNIIIAWPGALKKELNHKNIATNNDLLGIYDFNSDLEPKDIFERFLSSANKTNSIIVSHPSLENKLLDGNSSNIDKKRVMEFNYLESKIYKDTLERHGLYLTRFNYTTMDGQIN